MEILPGIHLVDNLSFSGLLGSMSVNVALLVEDSSITMVDAGPLGAEEFVLNYIRKIGHTPTAVKRIIITHHHYDHIGALAGLVEATDAEVWVHKEDAGFIDGSATPPPPALPEEKIRTSFPDVKPEQITSLRKQLTDHAAAVKPVKVDSRLKGEEELGILGGCRVVHTPGHTRGHICLFLPERSLLIAGDLLQYEQGQVIGPVAGFTPDLEQANNSVIQIAQLSFDHMFGYHGSYLANDADKLVLRLAKAKPK